MGQSFLNFDNEQVKGLRMWKVKLPCCYLSKLCPNLNSIWARLFIETFFIFSRHLFICFFNVAESKQTASVSYFLRWNVSLHHLSVVDNMPFLDFQQLGTLKCSLRLAFPPADVFPVTFASFFSGLDLRKVFLLSSQTRLSCEVESYYHTRRLKFDPFRLPEKMIQFHKGGSNFKFVDKIQCKLLAVSYGHMYVL